MSFALSAMDASRGFAYKSGGRRWPPPWPPSAGAALEARRQPHAGKAMRIAGRLSDDRWATPGAGPEILDVDVVHLVGDVIEERSHRELAAVALEPGAQVEDAERPLDRPRVLIDQHLRRGAVAVVTAEHQLERMTAQRHTLLEADNGLELGRIRHGLSVDILHPLRNAVDHHRRAALRRGL